jgi:putative two-component system response regulator
MLAEKLGLSKEDQEQIYTMGILHDLGKVAVPNAIINKPGKLTDEEFAIMKSHPAKGYDILSKVKTLPNLADGARWHHERIDGKGYPDHLSGEEIPYFAKIICVADAYDAMTSYRSYRGVMSQDKVREQIVNGLGTQFDFEIGQKMLEIMDEDVDYTLHEVREEELEQAKGAAS